jgi:fructose-1,6-bisphosphatase/inositol monophosphatase family enzyme
MKNLLTKFFRFSMIPFDLITEEAGGKVTDVNGEKIADMMKTGQGV